MNANLQRKGSGAYDKRNVLDAELLNTLFGSHPERVYVKNLERRIWYANREAIVAAGCKLIGKRDEDLFIGEHLDSARSDERDLISRNTDIIQKVEFETWKDGRLKTVRTIKRLLFDSRGTPVAILGMTRDLDVVEKEHFLKNLAPVRSLLNCDAGVYCKNLDSKKVWFDDQFAFTFPGSTFQQRLKVIPRKDRAAVIRFLHAATHAERGFSQSIDFRVFAGGTDPKWIRGSGFVIPNSGRRLLIVVHQDITQTRQDQELFKKFLKHFPGYLFVKDSQKRIKFMNDNLLNGLGLTLDDVRNKTDAELKLDPDQVRYFNWIDDAILKGGLEVYRVDYEPLTLPRTGKRALVTVKMRLSADVFDPTSQDPNGYHVFGMSWDITDLWNTIHKWEEFWKSLSKLLGLPGPYHRSGNDSQH